MADMDNIHKEITIPNRIFMKGFEFSTEEKDLQNIFAKYGSIRETKIIRDSRTGQSKGYGFITFDSQQVAEKVIETCKSVELAGVEITVGAAKIRRRPPFPKYLRNEYNKLVSNQYQQPLPMCAVSPDGLFTVYYPSVPFIPPYTPITTNSIGVPPMISPTQSQMNGKMDSPLLNHLQAPHQYINEYSIPLPDSTCSVPTMGKFRVSDESSGATVTHPNGHCSSHVPTLLPTPVEEDLSPPMVNSTHMMASTNACQSLSSNQVSSGFYHGARRTSPTFPDHLPLLNGHMNPAMNGLVNGIPAESSPASIHPSQPPMSIVNGVPTATYHHQNPVSGFSALQDPSVNSPLNGHLANINGQVTAVNGHGPRPADTLDVGHVTAKAVQQNTVPSNMLPRSATMQYIPMPMYHADVKKEQKDMKSQDIRIINNTNTSNSGKEQVHSKLGDPSIRKVELKTSKQWKTEKFVFMTAGPGKVKRVVVR